MYGEQGHIYQGSATLEAPAVMWIDKEKLYFFMIGA